MLKCVLNSSERKKCANYRSPGDECSLLEVTAKLVYVWRYIGGLKIHTKHEVTICSDFKAKLPVVAIKTKCDVCKTIITGKPKVVKTFWPYHSHEYYELCDKCNLLFGTSPDRVDTFVERLRDLIHRTRINEASIMVKTITTTQKKMLKLDNSLDWACNIMVHNKKRLCPYDLLGVGSYESCSNKCMHDQDFAECWGRFFLRHDRRNYKGESC